MKAEFEMRMVSKLAFFLGFQIQQYHSRIFFCLKAKYARNLITKFRLDKAKSKRTPAAFHLKLSKDDSGEKVDKSLYCSIIGISLSDCSRSDLLSLLASVLDISHRLVLLIFNQQNIS